MTVETAVESGGGVSTGSGRVGSGSSCEVFAGAGDRTATAELAGAGEGVDLDGGIVSVRGVTLVAELLVSGATRGLERQRLLPLHGRAGPVSYVSRQRRRAREQGRT